MNELSIREAARVLLVRKSVEDDDALSRAFVSALRLSAETLSAARVGIWMFAEDGASMRCEMAFDLATGSAAPGEVIDLRACPRYAEALHMRRAVVADDAMHDARTSELATYLTLHGITSLLDCPVFVQGNPVGVICHEHVGEKREWSQQDKHFAATVSDMIGLYLEQHASQSHYRELLDARRELERRRVMESLGRMSAAVAHDFNNVLLALGLRTEMMRDESQTPSRIAASIDEVAGIIEQGRRLARKLLDFAGQDAPPTNVIDLVHVLRSLKPTLLMIARGGIALDMRLPSAPMTVRLERSSAEQVVMNLVHNARDAMLGGGNLSIVLSREGDSAVLRVRDTGVGMDDATREQIFEPFFTTKAKGNGDGLGLATVYCIVLAADGTIDVTSALGEGTELKIVFPCATTHDAP